MKSSEKKLSEFIHNEDKITASKKFKNAICYKGLHIFVNTIKISTDVKHKHEADYIFYNGKWRQDILYFDDCLYQKIKDIK